MKKSLDVPVLLLIFNRPHTTKKLFTEVRKARPKKLFIFSDGPRNRDEKEKIKEVREIVSNVDWSCEVKMDFKGENMGLLKGVLNSIDWFFENVEEGIILEDDCIPTPDFFRFCSELLDKYRNDERVMHITGCNFQRRWQRDEYSYYFSRYTYMWGFALWRRAWKKYNINMNSYLELKRKEYFSDLFPNKTERKYVLNIMDHTFYKSPESIDTRWLFSVITNNGLSIVPNKNLVRNIGFGDDSTHTKDIDSFLSLPTQNMKFPLRHPKFVIRDRKSDERYVKWLFRKRLRKYFKLKTGL